MVPAPDTPGEVPATGGTPRAALLHTDVVAGLGHGLAGPGPLLKISVPSEQNVLSAPPGL